MRHGVAVAINLCKSWLLLAIPALAMGFVGWQLGGYRLAVLFLAYFNRDTKKWNPTKVNIPAPPGDAMWPWVAAGDDGRAPDATGRGRT